MLLKERNVFEEELLLKVLGAGGNNHTFAAADQRKQICQGLSRSRGGFHDEMVARLQRLLHGFGHLQLSAAKFEVRMRFAEKSIGREELVQRGQRRCLRAGGGRGLGGRRHGESLSLNHAEKIRAKAKAAIFS